MGIYFCGLDVAMAQLLLYCSNVIYRDVVYADFAGAKICQAPLSNK